MSKPVQAWHFVRSDKRLGYSDDNTVAPGYVYEVQPPIDLCEWGLHASKRAINALRYAPGPVVCRVELSGQIKHDEDKSVATRREVLWMADATNTLHEFACRVAEQSLRDASVDDARCWAAIEAKRGWLVGEITDQELAAARDDAWNAAWDATWTAARAAARDAARAAARDDAWNAAWDATWAAAWATAWDARGRHDRLLTRMLQELQP